MTEDEQRRRAMEEIRQDINVDAGTPPPDVQFVVPPVTQQDVDRLLPPPFLPTGSVEIGMTDTDELVAFLRARLGEDERVAREATAGPWRHNPDKHWRKPGTSWFEEAVFAGPAGSDATCVAGTGESDDSQSTADARHIALWDPARVLAEVAAKRRILDELDKERDQLERSGYRPTDVSPALARLHRVARFLALPYADHADYREQWRP